MTTDPSVDREVSAAARFVEPRASHDDLSFEQLSAAYNYNKTSSRGRVLVRLLLKEFQKRQRPIRVLDIGAGYGIGENTPQAVLLLRATRENADELWGVEPDPSVRPAHNLFTEFRNATMETANLPAEYFDVAFSSFVMEHVDDPRAFMSAVYHCLKPGGVYIFITPNGRHYFTKVAKTLKAMRLDERILRLLRGKEVDAYHYPVRYKFNSRKAIDNCAAGLGFCPPEYAYTEVGGPRPYFPGPLVLIYWIFVLKRRIYRRRDNLLELFCRITKPGGERNGS